MITAQLRFRLVESGTTGLQYPHRNVVLYMDGAPQSHAGTADVKAFVSHQEAEEGEPITHPSRSSVLQVLYWGGLNPMNYKVGPSEQGRSLLEDRLFLIGEHVARQPLRDLVIPPLFVPEDITGMLSTPSTSRVDVCWARKEETGLVLYSTNLMEDETRRARLKSIRDQPIDCSAGSALISTVDM